jgi:hypothetical protein
VSEQPHNVFGVSLGPTFLSQPRYEEVSVAVMPTAAEVIDAKQAILGLLTDGKGRTTTELFRALEDRVGIPPASYNEQYTIPPVPDEPVDRSAVVFRRSRLNSAIRLALAELTARGLIVPGDGSTNDYVQVGTLTFQNMSGAERFAVSLPTIASGYRLTPGALGADPDGQLPLLDPDRFLAGLEELVDERARRCVVEALAAVRRGLWMSAVNQIAAVSEAAWYRIASALVDEVADLTNAIDRTQTAEVIRLTSNHLTERTKGRRTEITDVRTHATYLRDLRNYAVHPRSERVDSLEDAFTEVGAMLLVFKTHRYLTRLCNLVTDAGIALSGNEDTTDQADPS